MRFEIIVPDLASFLVKVDTVTVQFGRKETFFINNALVAIQIICFGIFCNSLKKNVVRFYPVVGYILIFSVAQPGYWHNVANIDYAVGAFSFEFLYKQSVVGSE